MLTAASVKNEWARRVQAEHNSAANTAELLSWLLFENVSPALIKECHRIVDDEVIHSALSLQVLEAAGGSADIAASRRTSGPIAMEPNAPTILRALAVTSSIFCCGETTAVPLFKAMHATAKRPLAKRVLARILKDEGRHRAFGWALLDELLAKTGDRGVAFVQARVDHYVAGTLAAYTGPEFPLTAKERAWGLILASSYTAAAAKCIDEEIRPRFAKRGIHAAAAVAPARGTP